MNEQRRDYIVEGLGLISLQIKPLDFDGLRLKLEVLSKRPVHLTKVEPNGDNILAYIDEPPHVYTLRPPSAREILAAVADPTTALIRDVAQRIQDKLEQ